MHLRKLNPKAFHWYCLDVVIYVHRSRPRIFPVHSAGPLSEQSVLQQLHGIYLTFRLQGKMGMEYPEIRTSP